MKKQTLYRGFNLDKKDIPLIYVPGKEINLLGFTSTTQDRKIAVNFAVDPSTLKVDDPLKTPVLLVIEFIGKQQYFFLDSEEFSAYHKEQEVLL